MKTQALAMSVDFTCMAFTLILFVSGFFLGWRKNLHGRLFMGLAGTWSIALFADAMAWHSDLTDGLSALDWFFSVLSCCMAEIMITLFVYYMLTLLRDRGKKKRVDWTLGHISLLLNFVGVLLTVIFAATGKLFVPDETGSALLPGDYYMVVGLTPMLTIIGIVIYSLKRPAVRGTRISGIVLTYVAFPFLGGICETFVTDQFPFSMPLTALALLIVYVVLQSHEIDDTREREKILEELSTVDVMTGSNNRRAFEERLSALGPTDQICMIFCDMNGLKLANDNFGHEAGDQMLIDFAILIRRHFGKLNTYRISGDEFVAICPAQNRDETEKRVNEFKAEVAQVGDVASVGVAYGIGKHANEIMDQAEMMMYEDKDAYYIRTGKPRRR